MLIFIPRPLRCFAFLNTCAPCEDERLHCHVARVTREGRFTPHQEVPWSCRKVRALLQENIALEENHLQWEESKKSGFPCVSITNIPMRRHGPEVDGINLNLGAAHALAIKYDCLARLLTFGCLYSHSVCSRFSFAQIQSWFLCVSIQVICFVALPAKCHDPFGFLCRSQCLALNRSGSTSRAAELVEVLGYLGPKLWNKKTFLLKSRSGLFFGHPWAKWLILKGNARVFQHLGKNKWAHSSLQWAHEGLWESI